MQSETAISIQEVSKTYSLGRERPRRWRPGGSGTAGKKVALERVSLEIRRSECVAVIGRNGAGKSTLLRIVAGIAEPDSGSVQVNGKVSAVIGLQAGFDPQLTGRENIFGKCALMGLSGEQTRDLLPEIVDFASIGEHMDEPLRTYSNGMRARLAFAVTFSTNPEILLVDETLAVGDAAFHRKCMHRIEEIRRSGATILLVSHGLPLVQRFCDRAVLLEAGQVHFDGDPTEATQLYNELVLSTRPNEQSHAPAVAPPRRASAYSSGPLDITRAEEQGRDADIQRLTIVPGPPLASDERELPTLDVDFDVVIRRDSPAVRAIIRFSNEDDVLISEESIALEDDRALVGNGDRFHVSMRVADVMQDAGFNLDVMVRSRLEGTELNLCRFRFHARRRGEGGDRLPTLTLASGARRVKE